MALDDDRSTEEAVGAEKSPRNVGRFVLMILVGVVLFLAIVLAYLHFHTPAIQQ